MTCARRPAAEHIRAENPGDSSGEATPVPIPNTEVKLSSAEDTERAAFRENRSSPGFLRFRAGFSGVGVGRRGPAPSPAILPVMTAVDADTRPSPPTPADTPPDLPLTGICPYLVAVDGAWRSTTVAREHRCGAVAPPAILAAEKQRRLCLTADHPTCATYEAARATRPGGVERTSTLPRPVARTTPVVLDHGRIAITMPALRGERLSGQAILVILLALAFVAIVAARLTAGGVPGVV